MADIPSSIIGQKTSAFSAPVVIASDQSPVTVQGTVTTVGGTGSGGGGYSGQTDETVFTQGTSIFAVVGGEYTTAPSTMTSGSAGAAQLTALRALHVNLRDSSGVEVTTRTVQGTVTTIPSGTTTVGGTVTSVPSGTQTAAISGNVTINAIPSGTNTIGSVTVLPSGTQTIAGTITTVPSGTTTVATPTNASVNVAQFGGTNVVTGTGASGVGIPRVTVSNDSAVVVSGTVTNVQSGTAPVSGTVTIVPSGTTTIAPTGTTTVVVTGTTTAYPYYGGGTLIAKTGTLTSTTTTSQAILSYTITSGKTLYLSGYNIEVRPSTLSATATVLGAVALEVPSATPVQGHTMVNPTSEAVDRILFNFANPLPVGTGTNAIRLAVTPAATTADIWIGNLIGYEQ